MSKEELREEAGDSGDRLPLMGVSRLVLSNFRNYASLEIDFSEGFHVVAGQNAQGKTNLLEALYLLSSTRLLRGIRDYEAIRQGSDRAEVHAQLINSSTELSIVMDRGSRKRALLNGLGLPRAADIIGRLPCVCISAADMPIVSGEPSDRRLFLDLELSQLYSSYLRHLSLYKRATEQRNVLLKNAQNGYVSPEFFESWEMQMAQHGAGLRQARIKYVQELQPHAQRAQEHLGGGEALGVAYAAKDEVISQEDLLDLLQRTRHQDVARGTTQIGPHRDDLLLTVSEKEARLYGSQGQQRSAVISLKLATLELAAEKQGAPPLLLLDDILSDLDQSRRGMLIDWVVEHAGQAVLTCTESSAAGTKILERARVFEVRAGVVTEVGSSSA